MLEAAIDIAANSATALVAAVIPQRSFLEAVRDRRRRFRPGHSSLSVGPLIIRARNQNINFLSRALTAVPDPDQTRHRIAGEAIRLAETQRIILLQDAAIDVYKWIVVRHEVISGKTLRPAGRHRGMMKRLPANSVAERRIPVHINPEDAGE